MKKPYRPQGVLRRMLPGSIGDAELAHYVLTELDTMVTPFEDLKDITQALDQRTAEGGWHTELRRLLADINNSIDRLREAAKQAECDLAEE